MKTILTLGKLQTSEITKVGGKAYNLDRLLKLGYPALEGFCISQGEYEYFLKHTTLSQELREDIALLQKIYHNTPLALRSSASVEDSQHHSWAGQFESYLNFNATSLEDYILKSYQDFHKHVSNLYTDRASTQGVFLGLVIQRMLASSLSGVAFSQHPTGQNKEVYIEATLGYGEGVVAGKIHSQHSHSLELISETQRQEITAYTKKLVHEMSTEIDMEWSYEDTTLYILQVRPITTIAQPETHIPQEIFTSHISLTEWLEELGHNNSDKLREEDNLKRQRMGELGRIIDFPYDAPKSFRASELMQGQMSHEFLNYLKKHKDKPCALRLIPLQKDLPKLRMRGMSVGEVVETWFPKQDIDPESYSADFVPHPKTIYWSSICVLHNTGLQGELIAGGHHLLTQGLDEQGVERLYFSYDFETLHLSSKRPGAREHIMKIIDYLYIADSKAQKHVEDYFGIQCIHQHLPGYFETVESQEYGFYFIDWNRDLAEQDISFPLLGASSSSEIQGIVASRGKEHKIRGILQGVDEKDTFGTDDIVVCSVLHPKYLTHLKQVKAIISEQGGLLSHAAIVCRELQLPYIVGVSGEQLRDLYGKYIEIDMSNAMISLIE